MEAPNALHLANKKNLFLRLTNAAMLPFVFNLNICEIATCAHLTKQEWCNCITFSRSVRASFLLFDTRTLMTSLFL